ncbi:hypothetical protein BDZ85DRAFT_65614 [Elsinoe ampelina]|uniref:Zn(2)-C6 fungal-type domain-containing protein n=1 Tax=Elsinoe ampelina TaxID=302913 RepID=A0A6A6FZ99_9PEZI|nr:hypothetical protein BDZ85DRAFT_65614 [Elsinoe ampelina]
MAHTKESVTDVAQKRACDACRARKVRCDKGSPCSHCKSGGMICRTTTAQTGESKSRVIITKQYENKIDRIEDRLKSIERLLQEQSNSGRSSTTYHDRDSTDASSSPTTMHATESLSIPDATNDTHTRIATGLVENVIGKSSTRLQNSDLAGALESLKEMVAKIDDIPSASGFLASGQSSAFSEASEALSKDEVDRLVETAAGKCIYYQTNWTNTYFAGSICLSFAPTLSVPLLRDMWNSVYSTNGQNNAVRRVLLYSTLWYLGNEYSDLGQDRAFAARCKDLQHIFLMRLDQATNDLKLIMSPTAEATNALVMAASIAVNLCRSRLAQVLSAKAASMVIALGYHRLSTMQNDTEEERQGKILLFWLTYWIDTSFAIRYGQVPVIQNYAISVPRMSHDSAIPNTFVEAFGHSCRIGDLQCQVVEQLYSPLAAAVSLEERHRRASKLLDALRESWALREQVRNDPRLLFSADLIFVQSSSSILGEVGHPDFRMLFKEADAVIHHSTITLVKHATMTTAHSQSPALDAARNALMITVRSWERYKHLPQMIWTAHCGWIILLAPITPFVVVFCQIIAQPQSANSDLDLLANFVATLKEQRRFSEGMIRLHKLCDVFWKVASLYVRAKATENEIRPQPRIQSDLEDLPDNWALPTSAEIDAQLSSIGFAPPSQNTSAMFDMPSDEAFVDPNQLMDWYQGNNSLMSMLDQDYLFAPDLGTNGMFSD